MLAISPGNHERSPVRTAQYNIHASSQPRRHENVWNRHDQDLDVGAWLSTIRGGDTIQLIPRAEFPGWVNYIHEAELRAEGHVLSGAVWHSLSPIPTESVQGPAYYQKLDLARQQIRVLEIEAGQFDDPIICGMKTLFLLDEDHMEYSTLSYCWGSLTETSTLKLRPSDDTQREASSEYDVIVTSTLHDALRHLRPENGSPLVLWVDFVCINQNDLDERASQVAIMTYIYSSAIRVHIWLGPSSEESAYCFRFIQRIIQRADAVPFKANRTDEEIDHLHEPGKFHDNIPFVDKWRKCDFAWFKRTWVLQEVANANLAVVHCGRDSLPWPVILRLSECIIAAKRLTSLFRYAIMPPVFSRLFEITGEGYTSTRRSARREILDVLVGAHDLDATDPRDKVFALLQFGTETHDVERLPPEIVPDYRKSTVQVFTNFTRWWIQEHKSLRILSAVHTLRDRGWQQMSAGDQIDLSELDHPSWSFWYSGTASWAKATLGLNYDSPHRASANTVPDLDLLQVSPEQGSILRLAGHKICTITSIQSCPFFARGLPQELRQTFEDMFDPNGHWKTWIWNREEQEARPNTRHAPDYGQHFAPHQEYILQSHGCFPCYSPCLFRSDQGADGVKIGLCPHYARVGDVVVILYGGTVPYVLRETTSGEASEGDLTWYLVGECYLRGHMDGCALESEKEVFDIV